MHVCPWWFCYSFDNPLRRFFHDSEPLLALYVKPGMTAVDIGCGMGYFTIPLARITGPGGKVIAVDLQERMLDALVRRAAKAGVADRIVPHRCQKERLGVEGPADSAVCADHVDNDCDGAVDAADRGCAATAACADADQDGFAACDGTCMPAMGTSCGDCDDANAAVHPGVVEGPAGAPVCSDLIDNNCDGRIDAAAPGCATASTGADYDIMGFGAMCMATVGQPITLKVSVALNGTVDAGAKLTVSGVQDVNNAGTTKVSIPVVMAKPISGTSA